MIKPIDNKTTFVDQMNRKFFKQGMVLEPHPEAPTPAVVPASASTCGIIDTNLGLDHAIALSSKYKVLYHIANARPYPIIDDEISGDGFKGINKVDDLGDVLDSDFLVMTDCYFGSFADHLRQSGKFVFGPSHEWTKIENHKIYGWNRLKEMGVGVPEGKVIKGFQPLLNYIKENQSPEGTEPKKRKRFFIKTDLPYRGSKEVGGGVDDWKKAFMGFSQAGFGPYLLDMEFLVQDACPGIEVGCDVLFNGKDVIRPYFYTIEIKGEGTIGVWTEGNGIDGFILDKVTPYLRGTNYRGNISFEFFYDGTNVRVHDPTSRLPFPCSAIQNHLVANWPEAVYKVASGQDCKIEFDQKYMSQIGFYTDDIKNWKDIRFPKELRDKIGFRRCVQKDECYYFVPGDGVVATAVGKGDTAEEALNDAASVSSQLSADDSSCPARFIEGIMGIIKDLNGLPGDMRF